MCQHVFFVLYLFVLGVLGSPIPQDAKDIDPDVVGRAALTSHEASGPELPALRERVTKTKAIEVTYEPKRVGIPDHITPVDTDAGGVEMSNTERYYMKFLMANVMNELDFTRTVDRSDRLLKDIDVEAVDDGCASDAQSTSADAEAVAEFITTRDWSWMRKGLVFHLQVNTFGDPLIEFTEDPGQVVVIENYRGNREVRHTLPEMMSDLIDQGVSRGQLTLTRDDDNYARLKWYIGIDTTYCSSTRSSSVASSEQGNESDQDTDPNPNPNPNPDQNNDSQSETSTQQSDPLSENSTRLLILENDPLEDIDEVSNRFGNVEWETGIDEI